MPRYQVPICVEARMGKQFCELGGIEHIASGLAFLFAQLLLNRDRGWHAAVKEFEPGEWAASICLVFM
jgi:hypothetical protein